MARKVRQRSLAKIRNPQGRLDVLLYRAAQKYMERLERQHGLAGIRDNFLPMVEEMIMANIPRRNLIPPELRSFCAVYMQNRGRL